MRTCNNTEIKNDGGEESSAFLGKHNSLPPVSVPHPHPETVSRTRWQRKQTNCHHISMAPKKHGIQPYKSVLH